MKRLRVLWCSLAHRKAMWPIHEKYRCPKCQCEHPVRWGVVQEMSR
jgi:hypothetical protein